MKASDLTQKKLKQLFKYDNAIGIFTRIVTVRGRYFAGESIGTDNGGGYLQTYIDGKKYYLHRLAWLYQYGYFPENYVDHIDRDGRNNSIKNLREVSSACNLRNTGNRRNNKTGVKGVCKSQVKGKYVAQIMVLGKTIYLGLHTTFGEAVCHRLAAEQAEDWQGCDSSSPAFKFVQEMVGR